MSKPSTTELDEILNRIVSQESGTEGGYAEYALNLDDVKYGNPLHHREELKQAIEAHIAKKVREAYGRCLDIIDDRKKLLLSSNSKPGRWELDMVRRYIEALTPNTPKGE